MERNYRTRSPDRKTQKKRIKEITGQLEAGVTAVFESDAYKAWQRLQRLPSAIAKTETFKTNGTRVI